MKVLQLLYSGLGGHGSVVKSLISSDKEENWSNQIVFYGIEDLLPAYEEFCLQNQVPFICIKKKRGISLLSVKRVFSAFISLNPHVIILHSPTLILPAWLYCILKRKKLYVVEHTPHSTKGVAERIATLLALFLARKVICLSKAYQAELQERAFLLDIYKRTVVIRNGIDLKRFCPFSLKRREGFHIGMAGRFSSQKNQELLLASAIAGFADNRLSKDIHLHFAGDGETKDRLEKLASVNGLDGQVHFHGLLDESELLDFFRKMDLYVHASFAETMCTSVMQAMACGLPVLGSDIPGINDLIPEKSDYLRLLSNNDADIWIDNILLYYSQPDILTKNGHSARYAAELFFSAEKSFEGYNKLILN